MSTNESHSLAASAAPGAVKTEDLLAHLGWVRTLARASVGDGALAEDVEQEAWRRALERPPSHADNLRGWFTCIVRNVVRQLHRSETARTQRERRAERAASIPSPAELAAEASLQREVVERVLALDEVYRSVLILRYFRGLRPPEIARTLGVPLNTVRNRLARGLARVRAQLDQRHGRESWVRALVSVPGAATLLGPKALAWFGLAAAVLLAPFAVWMLTGSSTRSSAAVRPTPVPSNAGLAISPRQAGRAPVAVAEREALETTRFGPANASAGVLSLHVFDRATGRPLRDLEYAVFSERGGDRLLAQGRTDAHGRAVVTGLPENTLLVRTARRPPHAIGFAGLWLSAGERRELDVPVDAGGAISGRVVDDRGAPVEGLWVLSATHMDRNASTALWSDRIEEVAITDAQGRFHAQHLRSLPKGVWIVEDELRPERWSAVGLQVQDPRFGEWGLTPARAQVDVGDEVVLEDLVHARAESFAGTVMGTDGEPLVGALVSALPSRARRLVDGFRFARDPDHVGAPWNPAFRLCPGEAVTDAAGHFEFERPSNREDVSGVVIWTAAGALVHRELPTIGPGGVRLNVEWVIDAPHVLQLAIEGGEGAPIEPWQARGAAGRSYSTRRFGSFLKQIRGKVVLSDGAQVEFDDALLANGVLSVMLPRPTTEVRRLLVFVSHHAPYREGFPRGIPSGVQYEIKLKRKPSVLLEVQSRPGSTPAARFNLGLHACLLSPDERRDSGNQWSDCCGLGARVSVALASKALPIDLHVTLERPYWIYAVGNNSELRVPKNAHGPFLPDGARHAIHVSPEQVVSVDAAQEPPARSEPGEPIARTSTNRRAERLRVLAALGYTASGSTASEPVHVLRLRLRHADGEPVPEHSQVRLHFSTDQLEDLSGRVQKEGRVEFRLEHDPALLQETGLLVFDEPSRPSQPVGIQSVGITRTQLLEAAVIDLAPWHTADVVVRGVDRELRDATFRLRITPVGVPGTPARVAWTYGKELVRERPTERVFRFRLGPGDYDVESHGLMLGIETMRISVTATDPQQIFETVAR